eukprot:scaffold274_cov384-Prasinococcus_capsulatus_cf.AAC.4
MPGKECPAPQAGGAGAPSEIRAGPWGRQSVRRRQQRAGRGAAAALRQGGSSPQAQESCSGSSPQNPNLTLTNPA